MEYRQLGKSKIKVSTIGFGCWAIVGGFNWGPQDENDSLAALRAAYDTGINLFDTAEMYGDGYSEELIAKALCGRRAEIVIASKASPKNYRPENLRLACENSLRRLRTDYLDLYQLHWPNPEVPLEETLATLAELRQEGKIREAGVSNFGASTLAKCAGKEPPIVSNQLAYSMLFRAIEFEILPACRKNTVSVLCYSPLLQGLLCGKFASAAQVPEDRARTKHFASTRPLAKHEEPGAEAETFAAVEQLRETAETAGEPMEKLALAWLLAQDGVASVLAGGRNAAQVRKNVEAGGFKLEPELLARLTEITEPLKLKLGANADMWQNRQNSRVM